MTRKTMFQQWVFGTLTVTALSGCAPDLVPVPDPRPGHDFCKVVAEGPDKGKLVVTVKNQGNYKAPASTTTVEFSPGGPSQLATPPIPVSGTVDLQPLSIPAECFNADCDFKITVDSGNQIKESNEENNTANGVCLG